MDFQIVKVVSTDGVVGYGETDSLPAVVDAVVKAPFLSEMMSGLAARADRRECARHVGSLGADEAGDPRLWPRRPGATRDGGDRHRPLGSQGEGRRAAGLQPCSAAPGGIGVRAYASHPLGASLEETARHAQRLVAAGFTAVKFGWHPLGPRCGARTRPSCGRCAKRLVPKVDLLPRRRPRLEHVDGDRAMRAFRPVQPLLARGAARRIRLRRLRGPPAAPARSASLPARWRHRAPSSPASSRAAGWTFCRWT